MNKYSPADIVRVIALATANADGAYPVADGDVRDEEFQDLWDETFHATMAGTFPEWCR